MATPPLIVIVDHFLKEGYSDDVILRQIHASNYPSAEVAEAESHLRNLRLKGYIQSQKAAGHTKEEITQALTRHGYTSQMITPVLTSVFAAATHPKHSILAIILGIVLVGASGFGVLSFLDLNADFVNFDEFFSSDRMSFTIGDLRTEGRESLSVTLVARGLPDEQVLPVSYVVRDQAGSEITRITKEESFSNGIARTSLSFETLAEGSYTVESAIQLDAGSIEDTQTFKISLPKRNLPEPSDSPQPSQPSSPSSEPDAPAIDVGADDFFPGDSSSDDALIQEGNEEEDPALSEPSEPAPEPTPEPIVPPDPEPSVEEPEDQPLAPIAAYSWHDIDCPECTEENTFPLVWANMADPNFGPDDAPAIAQELQSIPEGYRSLFITIPSITWQPEDSLAGQEEDKCINARTQESFYCLGWDEGIRLVSERVSAFADRLVQEGGAVDILIIDFEDGPTSTWSLGTSYTVRQNNQWVPDPALRDEIVGRWEGIESTQHYQTHIKPELVERWTQTGLAFPPTLCGSTVSSPGLCHPSPDYQEFRSLWNLVSHHIEMDHLRDAVLVPFSAHYPHADSVQYDDFICTSNDPIYDLNGHNNCLYAIGENRLFGDHQAPVLYGRMGQITTLGSRNPTLGFPSEYPQTPFNAFRLALNKLRSVRLSSDVSILPWVHRYDLPVQSGAESFYMAQSDYWHELLYHAHLTDVAGFQLWNSDSSADGHKRFTATLAKANELAGFEDRSSIQSFLTLDWHADYMLSGSIANNQKIWRITVDIPSGASISNLVSEGPSSVQVQTPKGHTILFPSGEILDAEVYSDSGLWITQPLGAADPTVS